MRYIAMEYAWNPKTCPICTKRIAMGHGWVFTDPPPSPMVPDRRKAVEELFVHDGGDDCIIILRPHTQVADHSEISQPNE